MSDLLAFPDGRVTVPESNCSNCFAENPSQEYIVNAATREFNTVKYVEITLPLCEDCYKDNLALTNYGIYAGKYDPNFKKGRETAQLISGAVMLITLAFLIYRGATAVDWDKSTHTLAIYDLIVLVILAISGFLSWYLGRNQWDKKNQTEVIKKAEKNFNTISASVTSTGKGFSLKMFNDNYIDLIKNLNPDCKGMESLFGTIDQSQLENAKKRLGLQ